MHTVSPGMTVKLTSSSTRFDPNALETCWKSMYGLGALCSDDACGGAGEVRFTVNLSGARLPAQHAYLNCQTLRAKSQPRRVRSLRVCGPERVETTRRSYCGRP